MDFTRLRALGSLFSMLNQASRNVINYNAAHADFPMQQDQLERYIPKALVYALLWSFAGKNSCCKHCANEQWNKITNICFECAQLNYLTCEKNV